MEEEKEEKNNKHLEEYNKYLCRKGIERGEKRNRRRKRSIRRRKMTYTEKGEED